jgi:hypothetical protein
MGIMPEKVPSPSASPIASSTCTYSKSPDVVIIPDEEASEDNVVAKQAIPNPPHVRDIRKDTQEWQTVERMRKRRGRKNVGTETKSNNSKYDRQELEPVGKREKSYEGDKPGKREKTPGRLRKNANKWNAHIRESLMVEV